MYECRGAQGCARAAVFAADVLHQRLDIITDKRTLDDWLAWMETRHPREIELGLERVAAVCRNLGLTTPPFPVVTVGGTNGKGSVAAMLEQILHAAGYRVGLYTSPHLIRYNERMRVRSAELTDDELIAGFERVEAARGATPLTYFEFGTLAAVERFRDAGVEVAILEVGLGGRLDAVNVWDADVAIVVSVGTDHKDWLGPDRESIGREKAGIYRAGRCAICGDADPPATLLAHAAAIGARLLRIHHEFDFEHRDGGWLWRAAVQGSTNGAGGTSAGTREVEQRREQLPRMPGAAGTRLYAGLPHPAMRGDYQLANAACVLTALDCLADRLPVTLADIRAGLTRAVLPGRFQTLPGRPLRCSMSRTTPRRRRRWPARSPASRWPGGRSRCAACCATSRWSRWSAHSRRRSTPGTSPDSRARAPPAPRSCARRCPRPACARA